MSDSASASLIRVHCCISSTRYLRCTWITSRASVPGTRSATRTFITSSSRGGELMSDGVRSHPVSSCRAGRRDPETLLRAILAVAVGLDQPVPLQPLQRGVDLADIQRPDLAGPRLELFAQLKPVLGPLGEQREQRVPDAHVITLSSSILGIVLDMPEVATELDGWLARG